MSITYLTQNFTLKNIKGDIKKHAANFQVLIKDFKSAGNKCFRNSHAPEALILKINSYGTAALCT